MFARLIQPASAKAELASCVLRISPSVLDTVDPRVFSGDEPSSLWNPHEMRKVGNLRLMREGGDPPAWRATRDSGMPNIMKECDSNHRNNRDAPGLEQGKRRGQANQDEEVSENRVSSTASCRYPPADRTNGVNNA